jgi:hypothetical protein
MRPDRCGCDTCVARASPRGLPWGDGEHEQQFIQDWQAPAPEADLAGDLLTPVPYQLLAEARRNPFLRVASKACNSSGDNSRNRPIECEGGSPYCSERRNSLSTVGSTGFTR